MIGNNSKYTNLSIYYTTAILFLRFCSFITCASSRSWRHVQLIHEAEVYQPIDTLKLLYMQQQDLYYKTPTTQSPSGGDLRLQQQQSSSRTTTTIAPSPSPSVHPTTSPTNLPTVAPSARPTIAPTASPTIAPTIDPYKDHIPPDHTDPWYFNYIANSRNSDTDDVRLTRDGGSGAFVVVTNTAMEYSWGNVVRPPNDYWDEFTYDKGYGPWRDVLQQYLADGTTANQCTTGLMQSPIHIQPQSLNAVCYEKHQIRFRTGNMKGQDIVKQIESNKLRLIYERRLCSNITSCYDPNPPHADFPHGWGGFADLLHIDVKLPSEHMVNNVRYDGEIQYFHLHPGRRRLASISVLIQATNDGYNYYFDELIKAFQMEYNANIASCSQQRHLNSNNLHHHHHARKANRQLGEENNSPIPDFSAWAKNATSRLNQNRTDTGNIDVTLNPKFTDSVWNPYHEMLIPSIYFYRYDGSLTEPPCSEFVSWWISDQPMMISFDQLEQLKTILFTNVDGQTCTKTGVQYDQSVARPIQNTNNRPVWKCTSAEFGPD